LNDDVEDGVTLEAPAVQPEAPAVQPEVVIQPKVAAPIATMMERPRRQQRQPVHLQDCEVNLDDEVDDNGDLVHFAFFADSEPMRLADTIQHPKWQKAMNEELMAIEKNNIMTQIVLIYIFQLRFMLTMSLQLILQRIQFFIKEVNTLIFNITSCETKLGRT